MSVGVDILFIFNYAIKYLSRFGVGVGFVAGAVALMVECAVKIPQDNSVRFVPCGAIFVYIVPEVVWAVCGGGVNSK